ncbi:hypothetical protein AQJ27_33450 [Streptomyces olivochromogenes]|uniref:Uncharacterized protein n=1 Tax=Streptomyces olivochromogenes TaxID=1963 RepID=A0A250VJC5_STROL|nr:hypothetical protein AQJ27_33450 [Streptomyces olivochromogenes]GAX54176.1 hypothetical protein SO3561_05713 [Streptomyces olivochromogenes]
MDPAPETAADTGRAVAPAPVQESGMGTDRVRDTGTAPVADMGLGRGTGLGMDLDRGMGTALGTDTVLGTGTGPGTRTVTAMGPPRPSPSICARSSRPS